MFGNTQGSDVSQSRRGPARALLAGGFTTAVVAGSIFATAFVTALRWLNPIRSGYRQPERDRRRHAGSGHCYVRQRLHLRGHLS